MQQLSQNELAGTGAGIKRIGRDAADYWRSFQL